MATALQSDRVELKCAGDGLRGGGETKLQSDRVELKYAQRGVVLGLGQASIGPGGIEMVEAELGLSQSLTSFNRTGWN